MNFYTENFFLWHKLALQNEMTILLLFTAQLEIKHILSSGIF